jgi:Domain of unknown function (DUF5615)
LSGSRPKLRLILDEGVPVAVGEMFKSHGHEVIPFEEAVKRGSLDLLVCAAAQANEAILVAFDNDMKQVAKRHGIGGDRFSRLNLIKFACSEPMAHKRLDFAMSFLEHEWEVSDAKAARRLYVEIGKHFLKSYR